VIVAMILRYDASKKTPKREMEMKREEEEISEL